MATEIVLEPDLLPPDDQDYGLDLLTHPGLSPLADKEGGRGPRDALLRDYYQGLDGLGEGGLHPMSRVDILAIATVPFYVELRHIQEASEGYEVLYPVNSDRTTEIAFGIYDAASAIAVELGYDMRGSMESHMGDTMSTYYPKLGAIPIIYYLSAAGLLEGMEIERPQEEAKV